MFCRELHAPKAVHGAIFDSSDPENCSLTQKHSLRVQTLHCLQQKCWENLQKAYNRQAHYYNLWRLESSFKVGDVVLRRSHIKSTAVDFIASKLTPKFEGPKLTKMRTVPFPWESMKINGKFLRPILRTCVFLFPTTSLKKIQTFVFIISFILNLV